MRRKGTSSGRFVPAIFLKQKNRARNRKPRPDVGDVRPKAPAVLGGTLGQKRMMITNT